MRGRAVPEFMQHTDFPAQEGAPLYSLEAESALLGSLLLDNGQWDLVADQVEQNDFFLPSHRLIYSALADLIGQGQRADVITVYEHLARSDGGVAVRLEQINAIAQFVASAASVKQYCGIIKRLSVLRQLNAAGQRVSAIATQPGRHDLNELLSEAEQAVLSVGEGAALGRSSAYSLQTLVADFLEVLDRRSLAGSAVTGLPTGFVDLDHKTCGLQPGDLVIIAARPAMGKTSLALNIAEYVSIDLGKSVGVFSLEMGADQLAQRLVSSRARVDQGNLRKGQLQPDDWARVAEAVEHMRVAKLQIDETPGMTVAQMRASARRMARAMGSMDLLVVDYIQLMSASSGSDNRTQEIGEISRGLKMLAREMGCPVLALSQLNRSMEQRADKRPLLSDLRESGSLEQDADLVMFVYRDEYYNKDSPDRGSAEIIIAKHRNGPTGTIKLAFLGSLTRFENLASLS